MAARHPFKPHSVWRLGPGVIVALAGGGVGLSSGPFPPPPSFPASIPLSVLDGADGFVVPGIDGADRCGRAVTSAGDINGDGIDDVVIAAPYAERDQTFRSYGKCYVVFGAPGLGAGGLIDPRSLDGTNGFEIVGIDAFGHAGISVAAAGDVNDDGSVDLIIGARNADVDGRAGAGQAYVLFGGPGLGASGSVALETLDGSNGFALNGIDPGDQCGASVSGAGDVNDDGIDDIIIGAARADPRGVTDAGESYIVFGKPGLGASGAFELSTLDGSNGLIIEGVLADDRSGWSVSGAGDINRDGAGDVIIGIEGDDFEFVLAGAAYVLFGAPDLGSSGPIALATLDGSDGFSMIGVEPTERCGWSVAGAGDVNADGFDDVIVGAYRRAGRNGGAYVVFGAPDVGATGAVDLAALNGANGFTLDGPSLGDDAGRSVAHAGDVNDDGIDDLILGAPRANANGVFGGGKAFVVFGARDVGASGAVGVNDLDGYTGFTALGVARNDSCGYAVACAGDVNGDGADDVVIGAIGADPGLQSYAGEAYVLFGSPRPPRVPAEPQGPNETSSTHVSRFATIPRDALTLAAPCAADLDADGDTDAADLAAFAHALGSDPRAGTDADLNADGTVDRADFIIFASSFGCAD